jgi:hypothetical protein
VFLDHLFEGIPAEKVKLVAGAGGAFGQFKEMNVAASDAGGEDAVGDKVKAWPWH